VRSGGREEEEGKGMTGGEARLKEPEVRGSLSGWVGGEGRGKARWVVVERWVKEGSERSFAVTGAR